MQIFYFCSQNPVGQQSGPQGEGGDEVGHVEGLGALEEGHGNESVFSVALMISK